MSSRILSDKIIKPRVPDKGSFPLDHDGVCKKYMLQYMICLGEHHQDNSKCRKEAKEYMSCRMDNVLMAKENLEELGFKEDTVDNN